MPRLRSAFIAAVSFAVFAAGWSVLVLAAEGVYVPKRMAEAAVRQASGSAAQVSGSGSLPVSASGISTDPHFFPIAVWQQTPQSNAAKYKDIGINIFSGLYDGPNDAALSALQSAGLYTIVTQQKQALSSSFKSVVKGWLQDDEPDNAQPDGSGGYGPCVDPNVIVANYNALKALDAARPVIVNFGRGAADTGWVGRGVCAGRTDMYPQYAKGADILSFDIYPVNNGESITYIARGVENLLRWGRGKPVWAFVETTAYESGNTKPTIAQVRAEVWLALIHGASGIQYFAHILTPTFIEAGLLTDPAMSAEVRAINTRVQSMAPILNSAPVANGAKVTSAARIDFVVKRNANYTFLFAVNPTRVTTSARFTMADIVKGSAAVIGEGRSLALDASVFTDSFGPYAVHLYRISQ